MKKLPSGGSVLGLLAGVGVAGGVFWLYLRTLAPTMLYYDPFGMYDSVMLQVKAYVLGIPNPTGYPTYIMLAHLFTYLPVDDVGYRVNLASAVFGALSVFVVYIVCRLLAGGVIPSVAAAFLFGVSRAFWSQAVIAEVYTLNILFISLDLLVLLLWRRRREDKYLLLFAFLMGLSMTNHMTSGLVLPAAALFVALTDWRKLLQWKLILKGAGLYALGLLPYVYLPVRALMDPPLNETDPSTPGRFLSLVAGGGFERRMFAFGMNEMPDRIGDYAHYLANQFNPLLVVVAAFGALCLAYRRDTALLAMLSFLYLGWVIYALGYDIRDVFVYYIPAYLILCLFIAIGFGVAAEAVYRLFAGTSRLPRVAAAVVLFAVLMTLPLFSMGSTYEVVDRSEDQHGRHIMDAVIEGTEPGSAVIQNGGVMWYMKYVTGRRPDLTVVDPFPFGGWQARSPLWVEKAEKQLQQGRRVYMIFPGNTAEQNRDLFRSAGYELREDESGAFYEVVIRQRAENGEDMLPREDLPKTE